MVPIAARHSWRADPFQHHTMPPLINLSGRNFGRLHVIERAENNRFGQAQWKCRCECGNECIVTGHRLKPYRSRQGTQSCGCLQSEIAKRTMIEVRQHV